jgi:hypothetical protein
MPVSPAVLILECAGGPVIPSETALKTACFGATILRASSTEEACGLIQNLKSAPNLIAVVSNTPSAEVFKSARTSRPNAATILLTSTTILVYNDALGSQDTNLLDHVIANLSAEWMIDQLRITLQKILRKDIFGVEKYLYLETPVQTRVVTSSSDRDQCNSDVQKWVESCGLSRNIGRLAFGITEELLMNAIYDAPVAGGRLHYETMERTQHRHLKDDEYSKLRFGCDGRTLALSIQDPFGAFRQEKWNQYTRKILKRDDADGLMDTKKGGAGLGIFKMLYSSHGIICNVDPGKITEVIVLIDVAHPVRDFGIMPRSIHYFKT